MKKDTKYKGIVFDLDGTLVDSLGLTFEAFNYGIMSQGMRSQSPKQIAQYFGKGEDHILTRILGDTQKGERAYEQFKEFWQKNLDRVVFFEGILEVLQKSWDLGLDLSIYTGRSKLTTLMILDHFKLIHKFKSVITHDHVTKGKPDPEGFYMALKSMNLGPKDVMYIGDSAMDIQLSHGAGTTAVAALWDKHADKEALIKTNPHHMIYNPGQILDLLQAH